MKISAKVDYAVRAMLELASAEPGQLIKGEVVASAQAIPLHFMENILRDLRNAGYVRAVRGSEGGYQLTRPASEIALADVIRAVDGPLAAVQGDRPERVSFTGVAEPMQDVWVAVRAALRGVLEHVTLADVVAGKLPKEVRRQLAAPDAWDTR